MNPISLDQIRQATGAMLINADPRLQIQSICTDTREIKPGCLFIALKGETHDGHHHLQEAAAKGAIAAMVHDDCLPHVPLLRVADTKIAMGQLATHVRKQLRGTVIAVAGSNGKTGTKNLIHSVLKSTRTGTISPKSFNNDIGVPLTIFNADPNHDYLVLEIGTNHPGEILNLTKIAQPDVAIITNIGAEHLEFLGDLDGVTEENAQIIAGLNPDGLLIINGDYPLFSPVQTDQGKKGDNPLFLPSNSSTASKTQKGDNPLFKSDTPPSRKKGDNPLFAATASYPGARVTFGFELQNNLHPTDVICDVDGVRFQLNGLPIFIPLMGRHTAVNALAAIIVAGCLGVSEADILAGLCTAKGPEMRLELQTAGSIKILNDAYNANPHSMTAGLETLRDMKTPGRKIAILGDMRELGKTADHYHHQIGQFAASCAVDRLICIGEKSELIAKAAMAEGMTPDHFNTAADCAARIADILQEGDLVLLKASRGMKLETVANAIKALAAGAGLKREVASRMKAIIQESPKPIAKATEG